MDWVWKKKASQQTITSFLFVINKTYRGHDTAIVHPVTPSRGTEVGLHQIRLHCHLGRSAGDVKFLRDNLLHQRGGQRRDSLDRGRLCFRAGQTLLAFVEVVALGKIPGPIVLDPVVLEVPRIGGQVEQSKGRLEGAVEFAPFDLEAIVVQVGQTGGHGHPVVLTSAQRGHDIGEAESVLDEVHGDGVRADLETRVLV